MMPSNLAMVGYILTPDIFGMIKVMDYGVDGEI